MKNRIYTDQEGYLVMKKKRIAKATLSSRVQLLGVSCGNPDVE